MSTQFINGTGELDFQLFLLTAMALGNIPLSLFLGKTCGMGVVGIRLATCLLVLIGALLFPINLRKIIHRLESGDHAV